MKETVLAFEGDSSSGLGVGPGEPSSSHHGFSGQDLLAPSGSPNGGLSPRSGALDASTGSLSSLAPPPHLNPNMGMASPERRLSPISFDKPAKVWKALTSPQEWQKKRISSFSHVFLRFKFDLRKSLFLETLNLSACTRNISVISWTIADNCCNVQNLACAVWYK